jgi:hypothetical protein
MNYLTKIEILMLNLNQLFVSYFASHFGINEQGTLTRVRVSFKNNIDSGNFQIEYDFIINSQVTIIKIPTTQFKFVLQVCLIVQSLESIKFVPSTKM